MFQTFSATTSPDQGPPRLTALRRQMADERLGAYLVPRADRHQGEYVAPCDARLAWLTGFTGSAGFCAVLPEMAGLFVDGRYTLQGREQTAPEISIVPWPQTKLPDWLKEHAGEGNIGFDPWLHTRAEIEGLEKAGLRLQPTDNLVDRIWSDRPPAPQAPVVPYPAELAGKTSGEKRQEIARAVQGAGAGAALLTLPDSICWLLNIRGADIARVPVVQAFALIHGDATVTLISDPTKFTGLPPDPAITLADWSALPDILTSQSAPLLADPKTAPSAVFDLAPDIVRGDDPCLLPKAAKTAAEIAATRAAHLRDASAMVEFLAWLDATAPGTLTEIDVVKELEARRRATNALLDISFDTICGAGPNAAIVHYRVTEDSNRALKAGELLLVDSGGQYLDGTTDITRTIAIGPPRPKHVAAFTAVLRGMIALSRARFPRGLAGRDLDVLARQHLWTRGLDYDHGTGHGVGVYLSVHEGPQRFSRISEVPLQPGMILSNEPGYYRADDFGIRIENLVVVQEAPAVAGADRSGWLDLDTLTWVPIDRRLIDVAQFAPEERAWLDGYHQGVAERLSGALGPAATAWLAWATAPL